MNRTFCGILKSFPFQFVKTKRHPKTLTRGVYATNKISSWIGDNRGHSRHGAGVRAAKEYKHERQCEREREQQCEFGND
jgi:hypothetical protein